MISMWRCTRRGQGSGQLSRRPLTVRRGTTMISEGTHAQPTGAIEQNSRRLQQVEISSLSPIPSRWRFLKGVVRVLRRIHTPSGGRCSSCEVRIVQQPVIYRAPLTFGQLSLWRSIQGLPPEVCNLPQLWTLPTGTSLASVERALETLEDRHESLRTRYEADGVQSLTQAVWDSAAVSLDVVEAGGDGSGEGAAAVAEKLAAAPFDLAVDRPWRACAVTCGGVASRLAICIHHIAVDAWAINQLNEEFLALLDGRSLPDTASNPRDLAADQWSAARPGRRKSARRYWQEIFEAAPAMEREDAAEAVSSRWAKVSSAAAVEAAGQIPARLEVSVPSVVLTAFCLALGQQTGREKVLVAVYTNNRSDPRWEKLVAAQNQIIPLLFARDPGEEFD